MKAADKNNNKTTKWKIALGKIMRNLFNFCSFFGNLSVVEKKKTVDTFYGGISSVQSNDKNVNVAMATIVYKCGFFGIIFLYLSLDLKPFTRTMSEVRVTPRTQFAPLKCVSVL